jgi:hypothetical protein
MAFSWLGRFVKESSAMEFDELGVILARSACLPLEPVIASSGTTSFVSAPPQHTSSSSCGRRFFQFSLSYVGASFYCSVKKLHVGTFLFVFRDW